MCNSNSTVARINRLLAGLAIAGLLVHLSLWKPGGPVGLLVITLPVALVGAVRRSWRQTGAWVAYILALAAFASLRAVADDVGFTVRVDYAVKLERMLFVGVVPTIWLQERLYTPGSIGTFSYTMLWTHLSYFVVPQVIAFGLLVYRPRCFEPFLAAVIVTFYIALPIHVLLPTAPPWLAAELGALEPVARIVQVVLGDTFDQGAAFVGDNAVAAMPSLHTAATVIVALALAQFSRIAAGIGWAYAALMVFALVYLGEHYVVDAIAGTLLAVGCWLVVGRLTRGMEAFSHSPTRSPPHHDSIGVPGPPR